jgi:cobalamin biosynthesis protein CbiD
MFAKIFIISVCSAFAAIELYLAQMDAPTISLVITGLTGLITAVFGGLVLWNQSKSKARIEEMKAAADIERIRNDAHQKVQEVRMEAQKAVSMVNAQALTNLQNSMVVNTAETVKGAQAAASASQAAVVASDQVKKSVEQLAEKIPTIKLSESDEP